jgi:hypothetical protein
MKRSIRSIALTMSVIAAAIATQAQTADDATCRSSATQSTGYTPGQATTSGPDGSRVAGAAKGAAVGAVVGGVQNNQYDNAPDALKDEHRGNQAQSGAAAGVVVAGSRNRRERRDERRTTGDQEAAWQTSYNACMGAPK